MKITTIKVNLKKRSYNIVLGSNILCALGQFIHKLHIGSDAYVITNAYIKNTYGEFLNTALIKSGLNVRFKLVGDTEKSKSFETVFSVLKDIGRFDKKKRIFIIALGGGVIGDLSGFIASIYKRGIPYIQVPTTLLAQVDSSIGGKTAIDLKQGKNLIGAFYQPRLVFTDALILNTLDLKQMRSGLAEVIKCGVIKDPQLFSYLEKRHKQIIKRNQPDLVFIVKRCSYIKADIVSTDEKEEKGIRTILNFGHTIGHALEAAGGYRRYNHGEAIALGMLVAGDISKSLSLIDDKTLKRIEGLIGIVGLPTTIRHVPLRSIINAHYYDKKFIGPKNRFVLIKGVGETKIVNNIPFSIIKEALERRIS